MSGRAGVELTPGTVRVVRVAPFTGRVTHAFEVAWDPGHPMDVIATLRSRIGTPQGLSIAIGLGFLQVMRVDLPPVPAPERARIIELEPDRYFAAASREHYVTTVAADAPFAFGMQASQADEWIAAFASWATVEWVEPAPMAVARTLGGNGDGTWRIDAGAGETGVLRIDRGRMTSVRRAPDGAASGDARPLAAMGATPAAFAAALGATRWQSQSAKAVAALAPDTWRARMASQRRRQWVASAIMGAAGIVFAAWAGDQWRERTLSELEERVAQVETRAAPADTALRMLRSREAEAATIQDVSARRADPFSALAAISAALPRDANVLSARASGNDWQLDGTTSDASALVPLLDRHALFDSVRFLTASSRYREANRSYETFSIALRYRSQP